MTEFVVLSANNPVAGRSLGQNSVETKSLARFRLQKP